MKTAIQEFKEEELYRKKTQAVVLEIEYWIRMHKLLDEKESELTKDKE